MGVLSQDRSALRARRLPVTRSRRIAFAILMGLGTLGFLEALSSIYYRYGVPGQRRAVIERTLGLEGGGRNDVLRYAPHPYFNHVSNPEYVDPDGSHPHHPLGIRATEIALTERKPGVARVVALGASTTYGYYMADPADAWPGLLGPELSEALGREVEVVNAGIPYYTTFELLGVASMWLPEWRPDVVLIHVGMNDAFAVGYPDEGGPDNTSFRHAWTHRQMPDSARTAMRTSYLVRVLGMEWMRRGGFEAGDMSAAIQHRTPTDREVRERVATATGKYFRRNVETLIALVRHTGAVPVLIDMPLNPDREYGLGVYYDAVSDAVKRNNRILADIAEEQGVQRIALYEEMRDARAYADVAHMSRAGMQQKSWLITRALVQSGVLGSEADQAGTVEPH